MNFVKIPNHMIEHELAAVTVKYGLEDNCKIHPTAIISKKIRIGNNVTIEENWVIRDKVEIGDRGFKVD